MVFTDQESFLFKSKFPGSKRQTAANMTKDINETRKELANEIGTPDTKFTSDNCNAMQATRTNYSNNTGNQSLVTLCLAKVFQKF